MILFQAQIEEHQKLAEHYRDLAAKREALAAGLLAFQQQADSDLSSLRLLVDKCKEVAPNAIAFLKSAVLTLFDSNDDGNDSGNQPTDPTPDLDDEKEHEQKTQADCGFDIDPTPKPALDPQLSAPDSEEAGDCLEYATLDGQHCQLTSPLASLLWEDAPLLGQCCTPDFGDDVWFSRSLGKGEDGRSQYDVLIKFIAPPKVRSLSQDLVDALG
jgi:hypothetical protein